MAKNERLELIENGLSALKVDEDNGGPALLHRFIEPVWKDDVIPEDITKETIDGTDYIIPPKYAESGADVDLKDIVGVSFFVPCSESSAAAHKYLLTKQSSCSVFRPADVNGVDGLAVVRDEFLVLSAQNQGHQTVYPQQYTHGHHYSVFPTTKMMFSEFSEKVQELQHMQCTTTHQAAGDAGSSNKPSTDPGAVGHHQPSAMRMRVVCEALRAMWEDPMASPNDAHLAFLLLHDIKARDTPFTRLQRDSTYTRLVYKAVLAYTKSVDQIACPFANVGGMTLSLRSELEKVLPSYLHILDTDSDEDEDESVSKKSASV